MPKQTEDSKSWAAKYAESVAIDIGQVQRTEETFAGQDAIQLRGVSSFQGQSSNIVKWIFMGREPNRVRRFAASNTKS